MKFLLIVKPRQIPGMTSAIAQAALEGAKANLKSGVADCFYTFVGGDASCAILNADSAEALQELVMGNPAFPFLEHETHVLVEGEKFMGKFIESLKKQGQ
jgi:hypothetical protein